MPVIFRYKGYKFFFTRMKVIRLNRRISIFEMLTQKPSFG